MSQNDYTTKITGNYLEIYAELAESINLVMDRINHTIEVMNNISMGDFQNLNDLMAIGRRSENDTLVPTLIKSVE